MTGRRILLLVVGLGVLGCVCCAAFFAIGGYGLFQAGKPVIDAGNAYLQAIKDGDYAGAAAMETDTFRNSDGSAEDLSVIFGENKPDSWNINSFNIQNSNGTASGTMTDQAGQTRNIEIYMVKEGDDWKITGFDIAPQE